MPARLDTAAFDREVRALLTGARWAAADPEQVLAIIAGIDLADGDSWLREWTAAGGEAWSRARSDVESRHESYLHAATYYGAALALIGASDGTVDEHALWLRQRECWNRALLGLDGVELSIPYEGSALPGYFFTAGPGRRPTVVVDPGGRMVTSQAWPQVGAPARRAGCHVLIFDGPGRQAALRVGGLVARPDWEAVLTPIADLLLARPDVDPSRVAVVGLEFGAFGVARGLTEEHRFAAGALIPGVFDGARPWLDRLPEGARIALLDEDPDTFERELHLASLFTPDIHDQLRRGLRWLDRQAGELFALHQELSAYRLGRELAQITTSVLVCEAHAGSPWSGQAREFSRALGPSGTLASCRQADDALADWLARLANRGDACGEHAAR
jgi:hypothetical protein